ncbi:GNAT family N-acetyltransferase [Montanilutibacter psychrotolerans]|uniref:N-acetyltransferase n=1 Tax=Montanilutibacter psychrotolerans TaxID=1327343 RepID=A0A3M8SSJ7_9GAMM|nr:GNAT family N-acetyltransferase [Lysobacter psychrotolerans]RNF82184.1 N-acetyltransferase [Lysobacter psychrotolerans]
MTLLVRWLTASELEWANSRYAEVDFLPSPASDLVAVAELNGTAAGLGRVTHIAPGIGELGGMYVFPEHRGVGASKSLIQFLISQSNLATLYCLPFEHLDGLYQAAGFKPCDPGPSVPGKVMEKHAWCNARYPDPVLLMCRAALPPVS